jgi:hypothetical protein
MAKTEAMKRAEVMRKEWWKSKSTKSSINELVGLGVLHDKELGGWRASESESFPDPQPGEIIVFEDFFQERIWGSCSSFLSRPLHVLRDQDLQSASQLNPSRLHFYSTL